MEIKAGQKVQVAGGRGKGNYIGIAIKDFDTETAEWYPIKTTQYVSGCNNDWCEGEEIPCRRGIDRIVKVITGEE